MDLKEIKDLMTAMGKAGIQKLVIKKKGGDELHLETQTCSSIPSNSSSTVYQKEQGGGNVPSAMLSIENSSPELKEEKLGRYITAPLVGTFYTSPSPDDDVFVKVGQTVKEDTVLCIIEAMKVMNEVKAGMIGKIAEVLVENGHPVEFGTKMFRIV